MKITKREKHLLWMVLENSLYRYILCHTNVGSGVTSGTEKADLHIRICRILCHFLTIDGGCWTIRGLREEYPKGLFEVHDWTESEITDHLDQSIGLDVFARYTSEDVARFSWKLFEVLIQRLDEIKTIIDNSEEEANGCYNGGEGL